MTVSRRAVQFAGHSVVLVDVLGDQLGSSQVFLNAFQHQRLDCRARHGASVFTKAGFRSNCRNSSWQTRRSGREWQDAK